MRKKHKIWGLAELSYRVIKNSNDYRSKEPNIEDLFKLNNLLAKVTDEEVGRKSSGKITEQTRANIFIGLPETQMWWQEIVKIRTGIIYNFRFDSFSHWVDIYNDKKKQGS